MEGMEGIEGMQGMEGMEGIEGMQAMEGMEGIEGMQAMEGMEGMEDMEGQEGKAMEAINVGLVHQSGCEGEGEDVAMALAEGLELMQSHLDKSKLICFWTLANYRGRP